MSGVFPQVPCPSACIEPASSDQSIVLGTSLPYPNPRRGKVRDVYDLPPDRARGGFAGPRLLIVATDRVSAFDVVMPTAIPDKGRLLTEISRFWFWFIEQRGLSGTHYLSSSVEDLPEPAAGAAGTLDRRRLAGRITIAKRCRVVPIECVVRGYLEGSGWKDYQATGSVSGVRLPSGLRQCSRLPEPIFTPATKAPQGEHDENISFERACDAVGGELMRTLRDRSVAIYKAASEHALQRGIIIADTKFEFGQAVDDTGRVVDAEPMVIDEALTPDSSRFWPADGYEPGRPQRSFDKQFLREYLETLVAKGQWNKRAPGPELPASVVEGTLARYREARERLVG